MATTRELKALLRPLLKRRPDLAYHRNVLFFSPLTHYARGAVFLNSVYGKDFRVVPFASQLYSGEHGVDFMGGMRLAYNVDSWVERREAASLDLCDRLERHLLPLVEAITDPTRHEERPIFMAGSLFPGGPRHAFTQALGACFDGDFERAEHLLSDMVERYPQFRIEPSGETSGFTGPFGRRTTHLAHLLRTDRLAIPALLREWEESTVDALQLTKFWTPTPFPCEASTRHDH
jgi:hypothetical protein